MFGGVGASNGPTYVAGDPTEERRDDQKELRIPEEMRESPQYEETLPLTFTLMLSAASGRKPCTLLAMCLELCMCVFDKAHLSDWCGIPERQGKVPTSSTFRTGSSVSAIMKYHVKTPQILHNSMICFKVAIFFLKIANQSCIPLEITRSQRRSLLHQRKLVSVPAGRTSGRSWILTRWRYAETLTNAERRILRFSLVSIQIRTPPHHTHYP